MKTTPITKARSIIAKAIADLEEVDIILSAEERGTDDEIARLDLSNPANKSGKFLDLMGIEKLYRLFDMDVSPYRAAELMSLTPPSALNRKRTWADVGGSKRERMWLEGIDDDRSA